MSGTLELQKIINDSINRSTDMLKYAEAKCISIIAVNSAIALFFFNVKNILLPGISSTDLLHQYFFELLLYLSSIFLVVLSSFISCIAIFPKFIKTHSKNYLFFFDISSLSSPEDLIINYKNYFTNGDLNTLYTTHTAQSLLAISKITTKKNYTFRTSLSITIISIVIFCYFSFSCIL